MKPLLSIAIPTFERARYLELNLKSLIRELGSIEDPNLVEIIISDNASSDETPDIVNKALSIISLRYIRNSKNIGSDQNIVNCFNKAVGDYILLLGDDDLLCEGALNFILQTIQKEKPGVICLRTFGYDFNPNLENPNVKETDLSGLDINSFLLKSGPHISMISACVFRRVSLAPSDLSKFIGSGLVQVHLVLHAANTGINFVTRRYWVACKRNNSGGYDFFAVFVENFINIIRSYVSHGLTPLFISRFERKLIFYFYPRYVFSSILNKEPVDNARSRFEKIFGSNWSYIVILKPALFVPRLVALLWLSLWVVIGRICYGDFKIVFFYLLSKLRFFRR